MDELIYYYQKLIQLLDEEDIKLQGYFEGDLSEMYRQILQKEKEVIQNNLQYLLNYR